MRAIDKRGAENNYTPVYVKDRIKAAKSERKVNQGIQRASKSDLHANSPLNGTMHTAVRGHSERPIGRNKGKLTSWWISNEFIKIVGVSTFVRDLL